MNIFQNMYCFAHKTRHLNSNSTHCGRGLKNHRFYVVKIRLLPSPSAFSKFVLSVLRFLGILKFLRYTQNILGVLKWVNLCSKILLLIVPKWFWVYIKNWACLKKLSRLKPNFEKADGLGIRYICGFDININLC